VERKCPECGGLITDKEQHLSCLDECLNRVESVEIDWSTYEGDDDMPYDSEDGSR
jgi:hypothetical protein